ncbi:hypothetical protein ACIBCN_27275 [Nocardia sp. NPDC051052]|uniref:hypothetical protein n=1 Tax=Nocardia sp. NPDC051052 TaxID=3364322 RepID=UPI0037A76032
MEDKASADDGLPVQPPPPRSDGLEWVRVVNEGELDIVSDYLDKELAVAWLRKSSFETRAFPIVTMDVGLVTLYLTLIKTLDLKLATQEGWPHLLAIMIVVAASLSILFAALTALPLPYAGYSPDGFDELLEEVLREQNAAHAQYIVERKIETYRSACASNKIKSFCVLISFFCMTILAGLLIASIIFSFSR